MMPSLCTSISPQQKSEVESSSEPMIGPLSTNSQTSVISRPDIAPLAPVQEEDMSDQGVQDAEVEVEDDAEVVQPPPIPHPDAGRVRALRKPTAPTRAQREAHEVAHLKYEPWCEHCVKGKGLNDPHRRLKKHREDSVIPVVSMDFAFSKRESQEGTSPVLVIRDHLTRITFAHPLTPG